MYRTNNKCCTFCKNSGRSRVEYTSHYTKSSPGPEGIVVCPVLLNTECTYCHDLGHLKSRCPKLKGRYIPNLRNKPYKNKKIVSVDGFITINNNMKRGYNYHKNSKGPTLKSKFNKVMSKKSSNKFGGLMEEEEEEKDNTLNVPLPNNNKTVLVGVWDKENKDADYDIDDEENKDTDYDEENKDTNDDKGGVPTYIGFWADASEYVSEDDEE